MSNNQTCPSPSLTCYIHMVVLTCVAFSGGSRPSDKGGGWGGHPDPHRTLEMAGKISPSCKWNGMFPFRSVATKKVEQLRRLSVCSGKFPLEPRVPFAFQPVEPEILAKWKAPLVLKIFFRPFGPQSGLKIRGGGRPPRALPLDPSLALI